MVATIAALLVIGGGASWMANNHSAPAETRSEASAAASGTQQTSGSALAEGQLAATAQLAYIAPEHAAQALRKAGYSTEEQARIMAGIKRREYRLAIMPVFDAGNTGGTIAIQSGSMRKVVVLSPKPQSIVLPITVAGEVTITPLSNPGVTGIATGAITVLGPEALPVLHQDEALLLSVLVQ
ncbi:hypothetical protein GOB81_13720 [Acetobacter sp. LMG 1627]|uniref:Uncharacterized protein n=2 Tax=Acetobacter conturbans TaxID=1737472 RepID=A0ABX0K334_9PROT|nr:hypothetical protein [Acetobacter conturbans]